MWMTALLLSTALATEECNTFCQALLVQPDCSAPDLDAISETPHLSGVCQERCCPVWDSADTGPWLGDAACETVDVPAEQVIVVRSSGGETLEGFDGTNSDCEGGPLLRYAGQLSDGPYELWADPLVVARFTVGEADAGCGCSTTGSPAHLAPLLALGILLRVRRRR